MDLVLYYVFINNQSCELQSQKLRLLFGCYPVIQSSSFCFAISFILLFNLQS